MFDKINSNNQFNILTSLWLIYQIVYENILAKYFVKLLNREKEWRHGCLNNCIPRNATVFKFLHLICTQCYLENVILHADSNGKPINTSISYPSARWNYNIYVNHIWNSSVSFILSKGWNLHAHPSK